MATITYNGVTHTVTKRQGHTMDLRTAEYFDSVDKTMPGGVVIVQAAFHKGTSASAGTHDGPGALDLKPADPNRRNTAGYKLLEKICRQRGGAAWFRAWANNFHVHIIVIGTKGLPRIAAKQVTSYLAGRDGLVSNLRITDVINTTFEKWKASFEKTAATLTDTAKVRLLQKAVHQTVDGSWGEQTDIDLRNTRAEALVKYNGTYFNKWNADQKKRMQKSWGAYPDGIWGSATATWAKKSVIDIQRALGVTADGIWGPVTDKAYNALRAKQYKAPKPPAPKPVVKPAPKPVVKPAINTAKVPVGMTGPIRRSNVKMGKKNTDVARYQAALFNAVADSTKVNWARKWGLSRADVFDGVYGPATADLTKIVYNWLAKSRPGQGWTAGATEPGPSLLKHIGFKNVI